MHDHATISQQSIRIVELLHVSPASEHQTRTIAHPRALRFVVCFRSAGSLQKEKSARNAGRARDDMASVENYQRTVQMPIFNGRFSHCEVETGTLIRSKCEFTFVNMRKDPEARRAVLLAISRGLLTVPEAAQLAGVSRQLIRRWCGSRGISVDRARKARNVRLWRRLLNERA